MSEDRFLLAWSIVSVIVIVPVFVYMAANDQFILIPLVGLPLVLFAGLLVWLVSLLGIATKEEYQDGRERMRRYQAQARENIQRSLQKTSLPLFRAARRAVSARERGRQLERDAVVGRPE
jgi:hypothetical protein